MDLRAILTHSDLNINMLSTMSLDFMLHDKPVINPVMGLGNHGIGNDQRFLNYAHIKHLTDSGASKIAKTPEELIKCIQEYLSADKDASKRQAFVDQQIGVPLDKTTDKMLAALNSMAI
jgi:CDP-glycerol glycerophosphotransferase (TagB/SpsB family)